MRPGFCVVIILLAYMIQLLLSIYEYDTLLLNRSKCPRRRHCGNISAVYRKPMIFSILHKLPILLYIDRVYYWYLPVWQHYFSLRWHWSACGCVNSANMQLLEITLN
jgi:hypothetical protein